MWWQQEARGSSRLPPVLPRKLARQALLWSHPDCLVSSSSEEEEDRRVSNRQREEGVWGTMVFLKNRVNAPTFSGQSRSTTGSHSSDFAAFDCGVLHGSMSVHCKSFDLVKHAICILAAVRSAFFVTECLARLNFLPAAHEGLGLP